MKMTTPGIMTKLISYGRKHINIGETVTVSVTVKKSFDVKYNRTFIKGEKASYTITKYSGVIFKMATYPYLQNPVLVVYTGDEWICIPYVKSICNISNILKETTKNNFTIRKEIIE